MWKAIKKEKHFRGIALHNFLALVNFEMWWNLAVNVLYSVPERKEDVPIEMHAWQTYTDLWKKSNEKSLFDGTGSEVIENYDGFKLDLGKREGFAKLFGIDEPIYAAEIMEIGDVQLLTYIHGPKSQIIEASKMASNHLLISTEFYWEYLVPQVELFLLQRNRNVAMDYRDTASIGLVRDQSGQRMRP